MLGGRRRVGVPAVTEQVYELEALLSRRCVVFRCGMLAKNRGVF